MRDTRYPSAEEHPPSPPSKGGRAERKGDVILSKGECSAVSRQHSAFSVRSWVLGLGR